jgi:predicted nucleic acid-binding Zn ribbon protein
MPKAKRRKKVFTLKEVIKITLSKRRISKKITQGELLLNWEKIVGENLAKFSYPLYIKNKVLFIGCQSPVFISELKFNEKDVIKKAKKFTKVKIEKVKFKVLEA